MVNVPAKTTDSDSQLLENKQSELSHKVWKLETSNPVINLGSDGNIPSGIERVIKNQMKKNQVYSSNFGQNGDERRLLIKIGNDIFYLDSFKIGTQSDVDVLGDSLGDLIDDKEPIIIVGTTAQYWRGDKTWQTLDKSAVGLGNVDNTSDANKPVSTAQATAIGLKVAKQTLTDNAVVRADGTAGEVQNSGVTIDDNNKVETPGSFKVNANTSFVTSDGPKIYRASDLGMVIQGYAGSTASVCFVTPTGTRLMENPNGTTNLVSGPTGIVNYYLGYSTMTANNPTFYVYGWDSGSSSAKFGQLKLLSTGSFQILAQSGEDLELGAGGATIIHVLSAGGVGIGGSPNANAILDCQSTTKPFMPPRMTTTQRDAVSSPTAGMVIYNTTTNKLNVYTTAWEAVTSS